MASPALSQNPTEARYSWIRQLPEAIRHRILQIATKTLARRYPTPATRVQISIRYTSQTPGGVRKKLCWAGGYRSVAQNEALDPLLAACRRTREAVLGTEVFSLAVEKDTGDQTHPRYEQFLRNGPQLPLFEGATQDLILPKIGSDLILPDLCSTISHLFGTKIRRIHLTDHAALEPSQRALSLQWIPSAQTQGAYRSGKDGRDLGAVQWILGSHTLSSYAVIDPEDALYHGTPYGGAPYHGTPYGGSPVQSMFEHEDALVFEISTTQPHKKGMPYTQPRPSELVQICEVLRQHSDGRLTMNKGLFNAGIEGRDNRFCPCKREAFEGLTEAARHHFPDLEYISVCVQYSDLDPQANL